jgi:acyl-coenzyme A thioesterase PaaI-like protein
VSAAVPEGWRLLEMDDPFLARNGPVFIADPFPGDEIEPARLGLRIEEHHCSFAGACHGGMIASVLDIALGRSMAALCNVPHAPTVTLTVDFLRAGKLGNWLESRIRILRRTRSLVFCDALLVGPEGTVARGSATFKLLAAARQSERSGRG